MNPWIGKIIFILGFFAVGHFRDPHIKKNKTIKVVEDRKNKFDIALIILVTLGGVVLPALWMAFGIFSSANYPFHPLALAVGIALLSFGLWLFKRSHEDLGTNWSVSLQVKENHQVVKTGIYQYVRHPMYSALFLYSASQAFLLPNWIVGPAGFLAFAVLYLGRVRSEETMMLERFSEDYRSYMASTKRLIPGVW